MKAFFEEYGFVAISAIVVVLLMVMAGPISSAVETQINNMVTHITNQVTDTNG